MDVIHAVQRYVARMTEGVSGMKALLLDKETTVMVSMVCSRSQVLEKEVFLFQRLDAQRRGQMLHMKAIVFLRPTHENLKLLQEELREPKFGEYHLFFSNVLKDDVVRSLAQADQFELVRQLRELYADFFALTPSSFSLSLPPNSALTTPLADRTRDGLFALLLALKKKPAIRYQASSKDAEHIAALLSQHLDQHQENLDFGRGEDLPALLLILDRSDDPVTPLLNQWTYQAMVHELLGIRNNMVEVPASDAKDGTAAPGQSAVLSPVTDDFFRENLGTDFGALHDAMHAKLAEIKMANPQLAQGNVAFSTIAEMQKFVEKYPEMNKLKDNVSKHVNILHCLSNLVDRHGLMEVSEIEQQLACVQDHRTAQKQVTGILADDKVRDLDKLRIALLYALRYQKEGEEKGTIRLLERQLPSRPLDGSFLSSAGGDDHPLPRPHEFPDLLLSVCGTQQRTPQSDLFNRGVNAVLSQGLKASFSSKESNAYMMHEPLLARILKAVDKAKLPEDKYPYRPCASYKSAIETFKTLKRGPSELIVFIVGGATYAECRVVDQFNERNKQMRVVLGATSLLSTHAFLESIAARAEAKKAGGAAA
mmetsp:Transcript_1481/g.3326  ORF Transcript_1481/g.3326 Transcript_1481/m.3326 type:complete len:594 (-) Transcript_1481:583-2364(-)